MENRTPRESEPVILDLVAQVHSTDTSAAASYSGRINREWGDAA